MTTRVRMIAFLLLSLMGLPVAQLAAAQATSSADERLRSLYNAEWEWRQQEFARHPGEVGRGITADHLPRVDAASQQARLAYWTRALATLDIDSVRPAVRRREESTRRSSAPSLRALASECGSTPTKRRSTATRSSGPTSRRARASPPRPRIARISRGCATCRATSTSRSSTCAPAWRVATPCRACRWSDATRPSSRTSKATPAIRCTRRSRRCRPAYPAADQDALRAEAATVIRDIVAARLRAAADDDSGGVPGEGAHDARGREGDARRGGVLPGADRKAHHADADAAADPRHRPRRKWRASRPRCARPRTRRSSRDDGGVLHVPADRPAVLRQDAARAALVFGVRRRRRPTTSSPKPSASCRGAGTASGRCPMRSRRSTPADAAASRRA